MKLMMNKEETLLLLEHGEYTMQAQFTRGSNYTFFGLVKLGQDETKVVYKPTRGEQPLWDFPIKTLAKREVAAYLLSEFLGWSLVPPTIFRKKNLPFGPGSLQLYIEHDPAYHYFNFKDHDRNQLEPVVLFDLLCNNADRKGSHVMLGTGDHIWCIDHGLCFHVEDKLRTVIWEFAGQPIPGDMLQSLLRLTDQPGLLIDLLKPYLRVSEIRAILQRATLYIDCRIFPLPGNDRRMFPYPPI